MNNDYYKINNEKSKIETIIFKEKDENKSVIEHLNSKKSLDLISNSNKKISLSKPLRKSSKSLPTKDNLFQDNPTFDTKPRKFIPTSPFGIGSAIVITISLILLIVSEASLDSLIFFVAICLFNCIKYSIDLVSCALHKDISIKKFLKRFICFLLVLGIVSISVISAFIGLR